MVLDRLISFLSGWPRRGMVRTGKYCKCCGAPMIAFPEVIAGYDENTGEPQTETGNAYCSRDQFCGLWGSPGF